jgi:hypothetical protein
MSFRLLPTFRSGHLALIAALALAGCGGGGSSAGSSGSSGNDNGSGSTPGPVFALGAFQDLASPTGTAALTHMVDAMVIGDHAVLRSDSATLSENQHLSTRFSLMDGQGKITASVDYGKTLAGGHTGDWIMLPTDGGFALLQASGGSRLYQFDAQAKPAGPADGVNLYALPTGDVIPSIFANAAAVDGNGIWVATTLAYPQPDKTFIYRLNLTKIDWNGKALTPTAPMWTSIKSLFPRIAVSGGAVMLSWSDAGTPALAVWAQGGGVPVMKGLGAGGGALDFRPLALNGAGKLGLFWGVQSDHSGNLAGLAFNTAGTAVLHPGGAADNWDAEVMSSTWGGLRRGLDYDLRAVNGTLYVADVVDDPKAQGDTIVLADYALSDAALATVTPRLLRSLRATTAKPVAAAAVLRQVMFADHSVLLISDSKHTEAAVVTRR